MKYVFFDLDETLIETLKTNNDIFRNIRRFLDVKMPEIKFRNNMRTILRKNMIRFMDFDSNESIGIDPIDYYFEDGKTYERGDLEGFKEANYSDIREWLNIDFDKVAFDKAFHEQGFNYIDAKPGIKEVVSYVSHYVKTGVITNGTHTAQWRKLETSGLKDLFDDIFVSGDFGLGKPDPKFYRHVIDSTNCDVNNSFMIGDNIQSDYFGSLAAGFNPIYFSKQKVSYNVVRALNAEEILKIVRSSMLLNL